MGSYVLHSLLHPRLFPKPTRRNNPLQILRRSVPTTNHTTFTVTCSTMVSRRYFYSRVLFCLSNVFRNELHAIVDEVYMLSVFGESVTFGSVLSLERYC